MSREPNFAVAFGGGGARGLAHIHVIKALDEMGIRPVAISGSSIGAMMGAGMAAGMSGREIEEHSRAVLSNRSEAATRLWRSLPRSFADLMAGGMRIGQFDGERILHAFMPDSVPERFEELTIPLQVSTTDFYGGGECVFNNGELFPALAASVAIPAIFRPVISGAKVLIDGGIANPVPFDLLDGKADIIIAVDVIGAPDNGKGERPGALDLLLGASQIMMASIVALKLERSRPQVMLRPPVSHFRVLDFLKIDHVLDETAPVRDETKRAVEAAVKRFAQADEGADRPDLAASSDVK